ncbi:uncharacterized protein RJT21DRAFT_20129 [Scheffersomyces amazonensis]|uniref:uncharacterized protein n=1 Tax=Scheffersomyces amazonensis TaxID=1078765 RepID=UPI00315C5B1E
MLRSFIYRRAYSTLPKLEFPPSLLHLKVGKIIHCEKHPNAEKLYVSQIQIEKPVIDQDPVTIQVCSGLVNLIPLDQMLNKKVVVLANLKPSKMRGVKSEAMLLATEQITEENIKVELINPPVSAQVGTRLHFTNFETEDIPSRLKPKAWEDIQSHLKTNSNAEATYTKDGIEYVLGDGVDVAKADTLCNTSIR